jgi:YHS domain-containing protein
MFLADPAKYVPVLRGDCVVCYARSGKRMPGNINHAAFHQDRLYLFAGEKQKQMFAADPEAFADADLALQGNCPVCLIEMNRQVPGKPELPAFHDGLRYLFRSAKQREMFLANPEKYRGSAAGRIGPEPQLAGRARPMSVLGTSGCAACDHGVQPLGAKDTLGLAINATDGTVYVVENAHMLYPKIYENRFDGLKLHLTGTVLKRDEKFVWIMPADLKVVR